MIEKKSKLKFYKDKSLSQEIENDTFDLGIIPAGETRQFTFWVHNPSLAVYQNLDFILDNKEAKIISAPIDMYSHATDEIIIECTPDINIEAKVEATIRVKGTELWT